jgi:CRP-like cAMP-binding protein
MSASFATQSPLRLTLQPSDVLPDRLNWKIQEGYIRTSAWDAEGEWITLGIWGPGDWITATFSALQPVEIQCLSTVVVEQFHPSPADIEELLLKQIKNLEEIFRFNRIRSADQRLLAVLVWIGRRFGQVSTRGYRLSLKEMNLTHKSLADLSGLTRVTVTKMLSRCKGDGVLQQVSKDDLFIPCSALDPALG